MRKKKEEHLDSGCGDGKRIGQISNIQKNIEIMRIRDIMDES
jgi:hypothetical protein